MDRAGDVIGARHAATGGERGEAAEYERVLGNLAEGFVTGGGPVPVIISGMAGSRQGWREAPYRAVPCRPAGPGAIHVPTSDTRFSVHLVPGLSQRDPADVMRGEETQIAGLLALNPAFDGVACLPGTHSKWVRIAGGEVLWFRTIMTGELFALLSERSVLRHSIGAGWDEAAFVTAVGEGLEAPDALLLGLFPLRSEALLSDLSGDAARARLSGLLIGAELRAMRDAWERHAVTLIGETGLAARYERALMGHGGSVERSDADALTRAGLAVHHALLEKAP
jgi:2-dehydro-3-deoxygalactonokinase